MNNYFIGLMSGTSMDSVDAVLVDFSGQKPELVHTHAHQIPAKLRAELVTICNPRNKYKLEDLARLDIQTGLLFAEAANTLIKQSGYRKTQIKAIGCHGQTIQHQPDYEFPFSLQIGDPNTIVEQTGITTVADFRRRDIAAGGQGAPLVPAFHADLFRSRKFDRVVLNIGGMANITILPSGSNQPVSGFDTGPGNILMDEWTRKHLKQPMDKDGAWAASGKIESVLLEKMMKEKFFSQPPPKSTGRETFNLDWLEKLIKRCRKRFIRKNVQTTLCELSARTITEAILQYAPESTEILVCGGGAHNLSLMFRIQALLGNKRLFTTEDYGLDPDWIEAMAFAWLAKQTMEEKPGNIPEVTGARHPVVLGGIYKGRC
ncbi:MAG: anhydro-N-acetylmuramic acid kinase [Gammaproteobacteria bacterium]|nr:anhydro-N-acetylmuramic acid kinase [Gammaproteobacteria bacterium]